MVKPNGHVQCINLWHAVLHRMNIGKCLLFYRFRATHFKSSLDNCDYIRNRHEKCIEMSTNMPGIDLEIYVKFQEFCETLTILYGW